MLHLNHKSQQHLAQDLKAHHHHVSQLRPTHNQPGKNYPKQRKSWKVNFQHRSHEALSEKAHKKWSKKHLTRNTVINPRAPESFYYSPRRSCRTNTTRRSQSPANFDQHITHITHRSTRKIMSLDEHTRYAENLFYRRKAQERVKRVDVPTFESAVSLAGAVRGSNVSTLTPPPRTKVPKPTPARKVHFVDRSTVNKNDESVDEMKNQQEEFKNKNNKTTSPQPVVPSPLQPSPLSSLSPSSTSAQKRNQDLDSNSHVPVQMSTEQKKREALSIQNLLQKYKAESKTLEDQVNSLARIIQQQQQQQQFLASNDSPKIVTVTPRPLRRPPPPPRSSPAPTRRIPNERDRAIDALREMNQMVT
jgi:hypothetical protein